MMLDGKSHKKSRPMCDRSRIAVRKIDAAVGQTYVVITLWTSLAESAVESTARLIAKIAFPRYASGGARDEA